MPAPTYRRMTFRRHEANFLLFHSLFLSIALAWWLARATRALPTLETRGSNLPDPVFNIFREFKSTKIHFTVRAQTMYFPSIFKFSLVN